MPDQAAPEPAPEPLESQQVPPLPQPRSPAERRIWERFTLAIPAYLKTNAATEVVAVRTVNVGAGGFHCLTSAPLELGDVVQASLAFTPHDILRCSAQVVRVEDFGDETPICKVSLRFMDLSSDKESALANALEALKGEVDGRGLPAAWKSTRG